MSSYITESNPNASQVRTEFFNDILSIAFEYDFSVLVIRYFKTIQNNSLDENSFLIKLNFAQIAYAAYICRFFAPM